MSTLSSWLLSIACVVVISVLVELVLPDGQMNKFVKVIMSFFVVLVVISPLPKLVGGEFDLSKFFSSTTELQEEYLYQININKLNAISSEISEDIEAAGLENVVISINANVFAESLEIFSVYVEFCDLEYGEAAENMDISSARAVVKKIISTYLSDVEIEFSG